jgi:hypothetical protein
MVHAILIDSPSWVLSSQPDLHTTKQVRLNLYHYFVKEHIEKGVTAFVFDLFGNASVRYEQCDGTTSLAYKIQGHYHLGG